MGLLHREDVDLNEWYKVEDITTILGMQRAKARAILAEHKAKINDGLLLPNVFKNSNGWHITGKGLITLLDILGKAPQTQEKRKVKRMAKKSLVKDSTALQMLEAEQERDVVAEQPTEQPAKQEQATTQPAEQAQQKLNFIYHKEKQEIKSQRIQLVIKPSIHKKLKAVARQNHTSVNDYICQLLENVLRD